MIFLIESCGIPPEGFNRSGDIRRRALLFHVLVERKDVIIGFNTDAAFLAGTRSLPAFRRIRRKSDESGLVKHLRLSEYPETC